MSAERMFAPTPSQYPEMLRQCRDLCRVEKALVKNFRSAWQSALKHHSESDLCRVAEKDSESAPSSVAKEAARGTGRDSWRLAPGSNARRVAEGSAEAKASVQTPEEAGDSV